MILTVDSYVHLTGSRKRLHLWTNNKAIVSRLSEKSTASREVTINTKQYKVENKIYEKLNNEGLNNVNQ